jgi:hypothetical protein
MRLGRAGPPRPQIPVIPLANLALLVLSCAVVTGMYSASRGPGLRFASVERDGSFNDADAVRVEVLSEQETLVDGTPVPFRRPRRRDLGSAQGAAAAVLLVVCRRRPTKRWSRRTRRSPRSRVRPGSLFPHRSGGVG